MSNPRVRKIADRIQVIVAEMLERRIKDPRLGFVTVTDVRVTGDSQQASIFYTVLGADDELASTAAALESAKGVIRSEVAKQLGMRIVPSLTFIPDALPENARPLDEVLARARQQDEEVAARRVEAYAGEVDPYKKPRVIEARTRTRTATATCSTTGPARAPTRTTAPDLDPGLVVVDKSAGMTSHDVVAPGAAARRHPQGRPRRHARPDGDRRAGARRRPGHPAARPPDADREVLRRDDPAGRSHHRRRRGRDRLDRRPRRPSTRRRRTHARWRAFVGDIEQVPTAVSAIKVDGQRAYAARPRGEEQVELAARPVTVHELTVHEVDLPEVRISVRCSRGTYVRAIAA